MTRQLGGILAVGIAMVGMGVGEARANLLVNGDFSAGNSGFTTGYVFSSNDLGPEGNYGVGTNPHNYSGITSPSFGDHSTGAGLMMLLNGSPTSNTVAWQESVTVLAGTTYTFSGFTRSFGMSPPGFTPFDPNPADLQFRVNGVSIGTFTAPADDAVWGQFSVAWNSGAQTTALLQIVDTRINRDGNDFALDDLSVVEGGVVPIPEPAGLAMLLPAAGIVLRRRRR
jgi:hypothetical protein